MQLTIKRKLTAAFGLVIVMMLMGTVLEHWARSQADATAREVAKSDGVLYDLEYLIGYIGSVTSAQRAYLISGDPAAIAAIPAMRQDADVVYNRLQSEFAGDSAQMERLDQYKAAIAARRVFVNKINGIRKDQGFDAAKALFDTGEDDRLMAAITSVFDAMKAEAIRNGTALRARNVQVQGWVSRFEIVSMLMAVLMIAAMCTLLIRSIARNVQISVDLVDAMSRKDLSGQDGEPHSHDELAAAIHAINHMKHAMTDALTEVARSSEQVAAAGAQIQSTTGEIAASTHQEQKNVEHFASSIAEMNTAVQDVAEHAERASVDAGEAVSTAAAGREVVLRTREAIDHIHESVQAASADIAELGKQTESIGEVVRIIQDIAGQTNLLALNAAIEAARAGEQGKGFAVVAQEVRQLSERTAKFTQEIAGKIDIVQRGAMRAVQSMGQGQAVVSQGVSQFGQVSDALNAITQRAEAAQRAIAMIAAATTQQSAATVGLAQDIQGISSEVGQTTQQVDQTAEACAELAKLAASLQSVVDGFRLPDRRR